MAQKLKAAIPQDYDFPANWIVQLTAVDPSTGALVANVNVSNVAIVAAPLTPSTTDGGGADYTPIFVPLLENPG